MDAAQLPAEVRYPSLLTGSGTSVTEEADHPPSSCQTLSGPTQAATPWPSLPPERPTPPARRGCARPRAVQTLRRPPWPALVRPPPGARARRPAPPPSSTSPSRRPRPRSASSGYHALPRRVAASPPPRPSPLDRPPPSASPLHF